MIAGPEFGADEGKTFLVTRALYGLKSASFSFRTYMAEKLSDLAFQSTLAECTSMTSWPSHVTHKRF